MNWFPRQYLIVFRSDWFRHQHLNFRGRISSSVYMSHINSDELVSSPTSYGRICPARRARNSGFRQDPEGGWPRP